MSWPKKRKGGKCEFGHEDQLWTQKTGRVTCSGCYCWWVLRVSNNNGHVAYYGCNAVPMTLRKLKMTVSGLRAQKINGGDAWAFLCSKMDAERMLAVMPSVTSNWDHWDLLPAPSNDLPAYREPTAAELKEYVR